MQLVWVFVCRIDKILVRKVEIVGKNVKKKSKMVLNFKTLSLIFISTYTTTVYVKSCMMLKTISTNFLFGSMLPNL